jgi:hypothetical protein
MGFSYVCEKGYILTQNSHGCIKMDDYNYTYKIFV